LKIENFINLQFAFFNFHFAIPGYSPGFSCHPVSQSAMFIPGGGAGGLVVLAGFKPVAGRREAAWVGSIPTRLRQKIKVMSDE
jgi:hypothetical protein